MQQLIRDCRDEAGAAKERVGCFLVTQEQMAKQLACLQENSEREGWKCIDVVRAVLQKQLDDGQLEQQQFSMELNALHEALREKKRSAKQSRSCRMTAS